MKIFTYQQDSLSNQVIIPDSNQGTDQLRVADSSQSTSTHSEIKAPANSIISSGTTDSVLQSPAKKIYVPKQVISDLSTEVIQIESPVENIKVPLPDQLNVFDISSTYQLLAGKLESKNIIPGKKIFVADNNITNSSLIINTYSHREYPTDFFLIIILLLVGVVISVKLNFSRFFSNYFQIAFNYQLTNKLLRDKNAFLTRFNIILNSIYMIVLAIFIYQNIYFFNINPNTDKVIFVYIVAIILAIYSVRFIIIKVIGEIFNVQKEFSEYLFNQLLFNKLLGLVLIPLILAIQYVPDYFRTAIIIFGLLLVITSFFIKLIRGYTIIVKKDILIFYVLLYLCTLEILPVLVGYSYLKRLI